MAKRKRKNNKQLLGLRLPKTIRQLPVVNGLMQTPSGRAVLVLGAGYGIARVLRNRTEAGREQFVDRIGNSIGGMITSTARTVMSDLGLTPANVADQGGDEPAARGGRRGGERLPKQH